MSFKARKQFRARKATDDDDQEEENEVTTTVIAAGTSTTDSSSSNKRKVLKGPSLSFAADEEEGDGDIKLKKSKASKLVKRMKQAPVDMTALIQEAPVAVNSFASSSGGGAYSADSLAALRQQQKYSEASTAATDEMDVDNDATALNTRHNRSAGGGGGLEGMELTGEEAETMEELTERLEANGNDAGMHFSSMVTVTGKTSVRFLDEKQELADRDALHQSRMTLSQQIRKTDVDKDRLSMGQTSQPNVRRDFVALEEEASEWEMEIVNRGKGALLKGAMATSRSTDGRGGGSGGGSSGSLGVPTRDVLTIEDVQKALQRAADSLTTNLEDADRRKDRLQQDIKTMSEKDNHLQTKVVAGVNHLNNLRELRVFCAEVVGMLRDKEGE